jgi:hypothetical protein
MTGIQTRLETTAGPKVLPRLEYLHRNSYFAMVLRSFIYCMEILGTVGKDVAEPPF